MPGAVPLSIALLLGIVEGLTEFLPVSSTGHLILVSHIFGLHDDATKAFEVVIQAGALLAVVVHYRELLMQHLRGLTRKDTASLRLLGSLAIGFVPVAILGLFLRAFIKHYLFNFTSVAMALIVGGVVMLVVQRVLTPDVEALTPNPSPWALTPSPSPKGRGERRDQEEAQKEKPIGGLFETSKQEKKTPSLFHSSSERGVRGEDEVFYERNVSSSFPSPSGRGARGEGLNARDEGQLETIGWKQAFWIGIAQCFSLWPGTSRAMTTIVGGQLAGLSLATSTQFSFLLALPTLGAATVYDFYKEHHVLFASQQSQLALCVGLLSSFVVAWAVIRVFLHIIQRNGFAWFAWYRIVLGASIIAIFTPHCS